MTTNVCNQGIAHLSFRAGGQPLCRSRRAHIVCAVEDASKWGAICKRCEGRLNKIKTSKKASISAFYADGGAA